ncbi:DEAD/DEAH box helicase [Bacillus shivajii]|uniref:DEAD/DEAH box helicase n=1 Tax=Bacillus shivajii TaxID=1983719 RepID=UPI001CFA40C7|nr:DEAD/DEAH box helicase [Bacillus shivajii]UCZ54004.1 DEAD/DEAH box helicase [Bacillus shivajii]
MNSTSPMIQSFTPFLQEAWEKSNFSGPTPVQEQAVPEINEGKDVIVEAPTGSGKTLAYLLPLLNKVDSQKKSAQVVIVAPSKELSMQIADETRKWSEGSDIQIASLVGGANIKRQLDRLKKKPQMIVGTPGRLQELIQMKKLKMHEVKTVVLDEADQLLSHEHVKEMDDIIKGTLKDRQLLVFSATVPKEIEGKAKERMNQASVIRIEQSDDQLKNVAHYYITCERRDKIEQLKKVMNMPNVKALAFANDIDLLLELSSKLEYKGHSVGVLHSEATKQEREAAIKEFRSGKVPVLLSTDVASRGLDIQDLTHVVQLDVPRDEKQYTHRAGRTGRAGRSGTVISIVSGPEEKWLKQHGKNLNVTFEEKRFYKGELTD